MSLRQRLAGLRRKNIAVISNPNAGKGTPRAGLGRVIGSILTTPRWHYDTATLAELDSAVSNITRRRPEIVAIVGGDGTIHRTLTNLLREHEHIPAEELPHILIVPTGTMNIVASSLGLTRSSAIDFAKKVAAKLQSQEDDAYLNIAHANIIRVGDEFGFMYGSGLPVNFLEEYYKGGESLGPNRALKVIFSTLWDELKSLLLFRKSRNILTRPVYAKVSFPEGFNPPVAPFMTHTGIMAASVDEVGFGARGMPLAMSKPNHFMFRSTHLKFWGLAANVGSLWAGLPLVSTFDAMVAGLRIEYEEPTATMIDGDLKPRSRYSVMECGPLIRFVTG